MPASEPGRHRFAAWTVASDFALPELVSASGPVDWRIVSEPAVFRRRHAEWYERADAADGLPWVWLGRRGTSDVLRFPDLGWVEIEADRATIACTWKRRLGADERAHLLINHVLPLVASLQGFLVLHASVVERPGGGAVAFVGRVGAGKSTIATYLAHQGWRVLSDDRLILDSAHRACAIAPYVRISPEFAARMGISAVPPEGHRKVRIRLREHALSWSLADASLERIVVLQRGERNAIERIPPREATVEVMNAMVQLGLDQPPNRRAVFERVAGLVGSVPCVRLRMTSNWDSLEAADELLREG